MYKKLLLKGPFFLIQCLGIYAKEVILNIYKDEDPKLFIALT